MLHILLTSSPMRVVKFATMARISRIHADKTPPRRHFIPEWVEARGLKQADLTRLLDVDKSVVSRWFSGNIPSEKYLEPLAAALKLDDALQLFRHPDDDWLARFFNARSQDERERIKNMLEAAYPGPSHSSGTGG